MAAGGGDSAGTPSACVLWAVDVEHAAGADLQALLELLPAHEQAEVQRYVQPLDQRRALASRLMMRALGCRLLGPCHPEDVPIQRTKGGKPFFAGARPDAARALWPNLNFNASHEGAWVVLASDSHALVGVDVAAPPRGPPPTPSSAATSVLAGLQARFRDVMSAREWDFISSWHPQEPRAFQLLWSLKEAFIKARGDGLAFAPLSRAAFELHPVHAAATASTSARDGDVAPGTGGVWRARLMLDGSPQDPRRWRFDAVELPGGHVLSVARGPPSAAVDANQEFSSTFGLPALDGVELAAQLERALPALRVRTWQELRTELLAAAAGPTCA